MSSFIPDYEYDIFISYRHKDNKYDGWVTEFVENLRRELEATFKEEISIYFDSNAHDGLHDTHDVGDSLKDKIKSLIFIPIVSRTYCDPQSFAWKHEFIAFRDHASSDPFGLKIKLTNGNVSSRILPIRIHDLDPEDIKFFETETGSAMRPVEFVFKSTGVNRPLRAREDAPLDNQNHTFYRDQINKVAMSIKEIITALKHPQTRKEEKPVSSIPVNRSKNTFSISRLIMPAVIIVLTAVIIYGATIILKDKSSLTSSQFDADIDRSIAVLPFADMSVDKDQEYFSDGLSEELLNMLAKIPALKVISRTSAFSFKGKNEDIRTIGEKLGVAYLLEGSVRKAAGKVRITAQLIRASDGSHVWSEAFDRDMNDIFKIQDEIANAVVSELKLKLLVDNLNLPIQSKPDVYNLWMQSKFYSSMGTNESVVKALEYAKNAVALDSTDARAWSQLSSCYRLYSNDFPEFNKQGALLTHSKEAAAKAILLDGNLADGYKAMGDYFYYGWDVAAAQQYFQKALDLDPNSGTLTSMGGLMNSLGNLSEAKKLLRKSIEFDPINSRSYFYYSSLLLYEGEYDEAIRMTRKAIDLVSSPSYYTNLVYNHQLTDTSGEMLREIQDIQDDFWNPYCLIFYLWNTGQKNESREAFKKFEKQNRENGPFQIAEIYAWYGEKEKAFEWLDRALTYKDPGLTDIKISIPIKPLQTDPRYKAILERLKLPL